MSVERLQVLCVHGIGHGEADPSLEPSWRAAIETGVAHWAPGCEIEVRFLAYDALFAAAPLDAATIAEALFRLGASGLWHGLGDLWGRARGFGGLGDAARWTAGMIAQWASNERLRTETRRLLLREINAFTPDVILAHSLGSLVAYDTLTRPESEAASAGRTLVTFGSQIANPFVRGTFGGRIVALPQLARWRHLYNPHDVVFTTRIRLDAGNFAEIDTPFDLPGPLDHDAPAYLAHDSTVQTVWREVAAAPLPRALARITPVAARALRKPTRRALLVGIDRYPDPANRLEGCVNDVFLMSSVLQESRFEAADIRVVLDERATAAGILERLHWLLDGARPGDERVFFYSGHGAQIPGYGVGDKVDHLDECLVGYDFDWTRERAVTDDQFYDLYSQLPYDTHFIGVFDCCHSGGMTRPGAGSRVRGIDPPDDIRHRMMRWNAAEQMWQARDLEPANPDLRGWRRSVGFAGEEGVTRRLGRAMALRTLPDRIYDRIRKRLGHHGPYLPVLLQACQESELSYEYRHGVTSHGAFTYSLAKTVRNRRRRRLTWTGLVEAVTGTLHAMQYAQTPALVCPGPERVKRVPWGAARARRSPTRR